MPVQTKKNGSDLDEDDGEDSDELSPDEESNESEISVDNTILFMDRSPSILDPSDGIK